MYLVFILICDFLPSKFRLCGGGKLEVIYRKERGHWGSGVYLKSENWLRQNVDSKPHVLSPHPLPSPSRPLFWSHRDVLATWAFSLFTFSVPLKIKLYLNYKNSTKLVWFLNLFNSSVVLEWMVRNIFIKLDRIVIPKSTIKPIAHVKMRNYFKCLTAWWFL